MIICKFLKTYNNINKFKSIKIYLLIIFKNKDKIIKKELVHLVFLVNVIYFDINLFPLLFM
jgi:hypothetical protein